ncbi:LysR family transcriptional regulator [bacterium]|nr:LysR family transcriptional regulator [bacterium]
MNNRQLEYYVETVKMKSFTKAANNLFVTQSTLSKAVAALESELKTALIDREAKEFQLTGDGETVFVFASEMLELFAEKTEQLYKELEKNKEKIKVGITPTSGAMYFSSILYLYKMQNPMSELIIEELHTDEGVARVSDGTLDMSVVIEPFENEQMEKLTVIESEAVLLVSVEHPLAARDSISLSEIKNEDMLMVGNNYMFHDFLINKYREIGCEPVVTMESNQWEFLFDMVSDNHGIIIFPRPLIEKYQNSRVKQIHIDKPEFSWKLSLIRRKDREMTPAMQRFWDLCRENTIKSYINQ